ncbi:tyrosine--tRNA ligase [endosymbiont 'TC1' of Trimyema compressum]|uniref:tyrosine--tRNA ligase n=1 Tax=endosymbiont 'TC1' of Trimyema compressum TaxID=243899 RepID=UPI0007F1687F|nr:tyrosine--tRNA ligase [endosymbiont 'TC1' of Trimyema compressum]
MEVDLVEQSLEKQMSIIKRGAVEIIPEEELVKKVKKAIKDNKPLKVKLGLDPSAPDIHLGHTVVLQKMKQFQDLGHDIYIIIGDFTGRIGDPSGKSSARKQLTQEEVLINSETYKTQIFKVLDPDKTKLVFNSEWLATFSFEDVIRLAAKTTVARILERDDFQTRYKNNQPIGVHEFFYPLMQGYDSVALEADVELGGNDQKFNLLMGRQIQKEYDLPGQIAITMPILEGLDGVQKMSKSLGNYVGVDEAPNEIFGKLMSIKDEFICRYFELATQISMDEIEQMREAMDNGANPRNYKIALAKEIITTYHSKEAADEAEKNFIQVFSKNQIPEDIPEYRFTEDKEEIYWIPKLLHILKLVSSTSEGKRMFEQGAVRINSAKAENSQLKVEDQMVIQVGKRKFVKIVF